MDPVRIVKGVLRVGVEDASVEGGPALLRVTVALADEHTEMLGFVGVKHLGRAVESEARPIRRPKRWVGVISIALPISIHVEGFDPVDVG